MTDYYGALKEAVGNLQSGDAAGRRAFFNRARRLLIERLQTADPPVPARELRTEVDAFDAAVRQIELELRPAPRSSDAATQRLQPSSRERSRAAGRVANEVSGVGGRSRAITGERPPTPSPSPPLRGGRGTATASSEGSDLAIPPEDVGVTPQEEAAPEQESIEQEAPPQPTIQPRLRAPRSRAQIFILIAAAALLFAGAVWFVFYGGNEVPAPRREVNISTRPASAGRPDEAANLQYVLRRQLVYYRTIHPPGTIVIAKSQHFLYVVKPDSVGLRYTFGMGPDCAELAGLYKISRKEGDAQNAKSRALALGDTSCRIRPIEGSGAIGQNLRTLGLQFAEDDFSDLFDHTDVDTHVVVTN